MWSLYAIGSLAVVAVFADLLANRHQRPAGRTHARRDLSPAPQVGERVGVQPDLTHQALQFPLELLFEHSFGGLKERLVSNLDLILVLLARQHLIGRLSRSLGISSYSMARYNEQIPLDSAPKTDMILYRLSIDFLRYNSGLLGLQGSG
jgi:hypothetical protein